MYAHFINRYSQVEFMENGEDNKKPEGNGFYTYRGKNATVKAEHAQPAENPPKGQDAESMQPSAEDRAARRGRVVAYVLAAVLAVAVLVSVILDPGRLGLTGAPAAVATKTPKSSAINPANTGNTDAALFLYGQSWDDKKHNSLKSLKSVKNLRYALDFFQNYTPKEIAAVPVMPCTLADVAGNYDRLAGAIVSFSAKVSQKDPVTEDLELQSSQPSTLLTLPGDPSYGGASLIVLGSQLDGVNVGDIIKCSCIPIYYYSPKDNPSSGGLLFITIPQLVYKVQ
jgi:hypothetical protein